MALDDPKRRQSEHEAAPTMAEVLASIRDLVQVAVTAKTADQKDALQTQVELMERLINKTRPENPEHPGVSVYSYPEGDLAATAAGKVKALKCKMFWVGYDLNVDTLTPDEIDLLNRVQPGDFRVTKADGTAIPFKVSAKYSDRIEHGRPVTEAINMWFPCKGDHRQNHLSMTSYLQQVLGDRIPTIDEAMAELAKLKAELASAKFGVIGAIV